MRTFGQNFQRQITFLAVALALFVSAAFAQNNLRVALDATDAPRNIFHVRETIDAPTSGKFALFFPKWIPGEHAPTGPLNEVVNLFITADGKTVTWQRDDVEMFAFYVDVPAGAKQLEVSFDLSVEAGSIATANLARVKWNRLVLYPRGAKSDDVQVTASMKLPSGWQYATALPLDKETREAVEFKAVNLTAFIDSPAIIGKYFAKIPLGSANGANAEMDIAAETSEALNYKPETLAGWKNLVQQANLMYGARHYNSYKFLLTLSDNGGSEGLEHHESSENGVGVNGLSEQYAMLDLSELLGHEYMHSWNGKYRRPDRLTTPDFEQPMHGELLWVYEGLTQYLGQVLPARAGLWTDEMYREAIADTTAMMDTRTGRRWRPLVDTSRAVQFTYPSPGAWRNQRRGVDYYYEGSLIWLEADVTIRQKSNGKLSLDDFLKKFHGGQNTGAMVKTYDLEEIVRTLNEVTPYDWRGFFIDRVYKVQNRVTVGGIENGGWRLVYTDAPNKRTRLGETLGNYTNYMYSLGMSVNAEGVVIDINPDLAAAKAGLAPAMTIKKVEGEDFTPEKLQSAVAATKNDKSSIKLEVENGSVTNTITINYKGGIKYPHLIRDTAKTDYLSGVTKPLSNIPVGFVQNDNQLTGISAFNSRRTKRSVYVKNSIANVTNVALSQTEIVLSCLSNQSSCTKSGQTVEISTEAKSSDETDVLTYEYTISGGKIIGQGSKVIWDLSGVKPGIYTITVGVNNGCGICGTTKTMEVKVIECPNCN